MQKAMEEQIAAEAWGPAKAVYTAGGNSKAYATFTVPETTVALTKGAKVSGLSEGSTTVTGFLNSDVAVGATSILPALIAMLEHADGRSTEDAAVLVWSISECDGAHNKIAGLGGIQLLAAAAAPGNESTPETRIAAVSAHGSSHSVSSGSSHGSHAIPILSTKASPVSVTLSV